MTNYFEKVCRTCMLESTNLRSLNYVINEVHKPLSELLSSFIGAPVTKNDKLPQQICEDCQLFISKAALFKNKCIESEKTLRTLVKNQRLENYSKSLESKETVEVVFSRELQSVDSNNDAVYISNHAYKCSMCCVQCSSLQQLKLHVQSHQTSRQENSESNNCNLLSDISFSGSEEKDAIKENCPDTNSNPGSSPVESFPKSIDNNTSESVENVDSYKQYVCTLCNVIFIKKRLLKHHLQSKHVDSITTENSEQNSKDHNKIKEDLMLPKSESPVKCRKCNELFKTLNLFHDHIRCEHNSCNEIKIENVTSCIPSFEEYQSSTVHTIKCSTCSRQFVKKKSYEAHLKKHEEQAEESHTCMICKRSFKHQAHLDNHVTSVHSSDKGLKCPICAKGFSNEISLNLHQSSHKAKKHHCEYCDKGFNMLSTLKDHIRTHTGEKPFLCSTCGRGFSQKTNLKEHMKRHQGLKTYKCENCDQRFVSKGELVAHNRKHSGAHPFICDSCGSGFTTSSSLVKHRRIHTGEKPYECDLCSMKFTALGTLKNHRRTHTGEKPYQCTFCEKAFVQKNDLVSHVRCHTGERPYVCSTCGQTFRQCSALKTHLKVHSLKDAPLLLPLQSGRKDNINKVLNLQGFNTLPVMPDIATTSSEMRE